MVQLRSCVNAGDVCSFGIYFYAVLAEMQLLLPAHISFKTKSDLRRGIAHFTVSHPCDALLYKCYATSYSRALGNVVMEMLIKAMS